MWDKFHISIVLDYFSNLSTTCDFPELSSALSKSNHNLWWKDYTQPAFKQDVKQMFVVPKLNKLHETENRINKSHLLQAFLSLLLQLLHHKRDLTVALPFKDLLDNLEKELRFLLTILGDSEDELEAAFPKLLPEFDALANQAGINVIARVALSFRYPLPAVIAKMKKLKYICVDSAYYGHDWKKDQTNNLEYISKVYIYDLRSEELLKCSPHLRKLKCIYYAEQVMDKMEYQRFDLCSLTQLYSLSLSGYLRKKDFGFPPNIRKLTLEGSGLLPEMSTIGRLKFLEVLKLERVDFMGNRWDTRDGEFQELRFLQLASFWLLEWNVASNEHFPKLQQLILRCFHLREIPSEVGEISSLELIEIKRGQKSLVESAERIQEEQREMGNEELRVIISDG